ncbi:MAG: rhamnulokinase [Lachnospiraceae bacterium]
MQYYLAVDIGASSGRHILGWLEDGKMQYEEIYRFPNQIVKKNGVLCWDLEELFSHIVEGMKECKKLSKIPVSLGIDTWAVDYVLLDAQNAVLGDTVSYRDSRTNGMDEVLYKSVSREEIYERTGIQKLSINTIFQLLAVREEHPEYLEQAESLLMIPDYFGFLLTGNKCMEYTNATTTQLVTPKTNEWDYELIEMLGLKKELFKPLSLPKTVVGTLTEAMQEQVGFDCEVVLPATHDTGSAVVAVPTNDNDSIYISSGTWSLMGIESQTADCSLKSMELNFTNEGGYDYRFRYQKNIMGLWMIQSVKKEFEEDLSFATICDLASKSQIASIVDCNDDCFMAPQSMIKEVQEFCRRTGQEVPDSVADIAAVIYNSLAKCYAKTVQEIEEMQGKTYHKIHIIGGGSNAEYLNELTARETGKEVHAGPSEATAIGNLLVQMLKTGEFTTLQAVRQCVHDSFGITIYS